MISCLFLERPGVWRILGIVALFLVAILPATPLLWSALQSIAAGALLTDTAFVAALQTSAVMALFVVVTSFLVGLPTGVLAALYEFPGRPVLLVLVTLPLLVPSFLWAIGWSVLVTYLGFPASYTLTGFTGCFLVFSLGVVPLVLLMSYAAALSLSSSQVEAARLAGGEKAVIFYVCRHVSTLALLTASLGGVVTLADPGPGQIFGLRTVAAEMLTSFSALYDFPLAGRQCGALAMLVLIVATPGAFFMAPRISSAMLVRQSRVAQRLRHQGMASVTAAALTIVVFVSLLAPLAGLTLPLARGGVSLRAWEDVYRTAGDTLLYAAGSGKSSNSARLIVSTVHRSQHSASDSLYRHAADVVLFTAGVNRLGACPTCRSSPRLGGPTSSKSFYSMRRAWSPLLSGRRRVGDACLGINFGCLDFCRRSTRPFAHNLPPAGCASCFAPDPDDCSVARCAPCDRRCQHRAAPSPTWCQFTAAHHFYRDGQRSRNTRGSLLPGLCHTNGGTADNPYGLLLRDDSH